MGWRSSWSTSPTASTTLPDLWSSRGNHRLDATADVEVTHDLDPGRMHPVREIVEDAVHRALVEDPVVPIAPEIELETLELETQVRGAIRDQDRSEIRRPALEQIELARVALDPA